MAVILFYGLLLGLAFVNMVMFVAFRSRQNNFYYGCFLIIVAISNCGYLFIALSRNLEEALLANKISYLAGVFLPTIVLLCVLDLCDINITWVGRAALMAFALSVYSLILSSGFSGTFYSVANYEYKNGFARLITTNGKLFPLFIIHTYMCIAMIIGVCIYSFWQRRSISYKNIILLLFMTVMSILIYTAKEVFDMRINFMPLAFVIDGCLSLALQHRIAMYDIPSIVAESILNEGNYGYMVLDRRRNYLASDSAAQAFFPQIAPLNVDSALPKDDPFFVRLLNLMDQLDDTLNPEMSYIERDGREYKIDVEFVINDKGHHTGYYVEITDATEERANQKALANYNRQLRADVERETQHLRDVQDRMLMGMANMIENRDNSTGGHIKRTSMGVKILVKELMSRDEFEGVFNSQYCAAMIKAAPLHDIGKIAVDDDILKKPGRFTPGEFEQMKQHAPKGAELLQSVIDDIEDPFFVSVAENMAHYHHERWNGTGYPDRLKGEQIPMEARVMAIADVYDALVSKRCYKDPMTYEEAAAIIKDGMGTQFDPSLEDVFDACRPRLERYYDAQLVLSEAAC